MCVSVACVSSLFDSMFVCAYVVVVAAVFDVVRVHNGIFVFLFLTEETQKS